MSTTKFEHVIGRDGLHRIRKTCVENGEIIGNSHEGFSSRDEAIFNAGRNSQADLELVGLPEPLAQTIAFMLRSHMSLIPTEADPLRHERVFGKPADPFEPQTPGPVEPQTEN